MVINSGAPPQFNCGRSQGAKIKKIRKCHCWKNLASCNCLFIIGLIDMSIMCPKNNSFKYGSIFFVFDIALLHFKLSYLAFSTLDSSDGILYFNFMFYFWILIVDYQWEGAHHELNRLDLNCSLSVTNSF